MIAYSDASFACRNDLSGQGGYMLVMVSKKEAEGEEGWYMCWTGGVGNCYAWLAQL
jgi:hypothetical protein